MARPIKAPKSKYRGVCWAPTSRKYKASIQMNKVTYNCGLFDDDLDAVKARDRFIIKMGFSTDLLQVIKPIKKQTT